MYEAHGAGKGATKVPAERDAASAERKVGALGRARRSVLSDERLAQQAAAGDRGAFEAIFSRYRDGLYRFCVGILREPQDAQDAVQNTMIRAMRALPGERRAMRLKPWLYRIAHNEAVEVRRRERPVEELPVTIDDVGALTDERAEENGRLRTLLADIADLPERQRASLVLREVNGLGFGEIGAALGTSPGAVRQALYEARRALGEMENGRDMRCEAATRMVSDADGRPRDRGVRAHLRDCSACRRFQAEIRERGRAFAAISPMPALAAAGALNAVLGGSGAAVVAGGAGAGAGAAGVAAGSIGASALLKPAVGLLAALAVGTAVDHGAILDAGRHAPATAGAPRSALAFLDRAAEGLTAVDHTRAARLGSPGTLAPARERLPSGPSPAPALNPTPDATLEAPSASLGAPRQIDQRGDGELAAAPVAAVPATDGTTPKAELVPGSDAPLPPAGEEAEPAGVGAPDQAGEEAIPPAQAEGETEAVEQATTAAQGTTAATTAPESSAGEPFAQVAASQASGEDVAADQAGGEAAEGGAVPPPSEGSGAAAAPDATEGVEAQLRPAGQEGGASE